MRKLAFILVAFLFLAGCSSISNSSLSEKSVPENMDSYNELEVLKRINEMNDGKTPVVGKNKSSMPPGTPPPPPPTPPMPTSNSNQANLDDLAKDFRQAVIKTNLGNITVEFYAEESPVTVNNFLNLARDGVFDGTRFHRIIKEFMIQGGDPQSTDPLKKDLWGTGGPGYKFKDEFNERPLQKGSLAMANSGPNTNGSQFFIVTADFTPWLDGKHTNFGYVTLGMDVVDKIEASETDGRDRPMEDVIVEKIELLP
jgi:cyclophilin family peptidyl-prolyl cis-trans isomerase